MTEHTATTFATFVEQVFFATVRVVVPVGPDRSSIGTGFLIGVQGAASRTVLLLVSNKHVFVSKEHTATIKFHKRDPDDRSAALLGTIVETQWKLNTDLYTEHPTADLACLNVSGMADEKLGIFYRMIPFEQFAATLSEPWLQPNGEVCFVGYPDGRFDAKNYLPILRRGAIATLPKVPFNGLKQFVIDAHVHPGSSGSPVFAMTPDDVTDAARLIGVLSETMIKDDELVTIGESTQHRVRQTIGLGIVLRVDLVRELVDAAVGKLVAKSSKATQ